MSWFTAVIFLLLPGCCLDPASQGCKFNDSSLSDSTRAGANLDPNASANFAPVQQILIAQCIQCHSAYGAYSEAEWKTSGYVTAGAPESSLLFTRLRGAGAGGTENMPPGGALSSSDVALFRTWISGLTGESSTPAEQRLAAALSALNRPSTFSGQSCVSCHSVDRTATSGAYSGATVPAFSTFTTDAQFFNAGLVVPGSAAGSWIFRALRGHGDIGTMPKSDPGSISTSDKTALEDWINNL